MNHLKFSNFFLLLVLMVISIFFISSPLFSQGIIIDHTNTDITKIPDTWITKVKSMLKIHYAHTSHGEQITVGLERLSNANSKYNYYPDNCTVPQTTQHLSLMDGQYFDDYCETYVTPDLYWEGSYGLNITRGVLNSYDVNISLWAWCTQLDYYSLSEAQGYLNAMAKLESEYPNVTFIYMTGNAQSALQNRYSRNNQIRNYCKNNNKYLFDFADFDCWYNGQQYTENGIPTEHPQYNGDQAGHTTYESCENKAKAFWWLLARIAGWDGNGGTTPTPIIDLDKSRLNFYCGTSSSAPSPQSISISNTGTGTLNWTVTDNAGWLSCTPVSGTDSGVVTVSVDHSILAAGTYTGIINVSDPNASNSPQTVSVNLTVYTPGNDSDPFGSFDTPLDGAIVRSSIAVTGWALDDIGVDSVKIYRESGPGLVYIGDAVSVEGARTDIEAAYPGYPDNSKAGWGYMMLTNFLPNGGNGTFTLHAVVSDITGHQVTLGAKTIYCDNANAVKPFGAIDTPTQGGTASGSGFINWGWVLTPQPNRIPTDGSTINVFVDSVDIGHPTYDLYRSDIAGLFPGYANSNGAIGYFSLDTTAYENGVHTIHWTAEDNAGNTDGIGSRYFSIQNSHRAWSMESLAGHLKGGTKPKGASRWSFEFLSKIPLDDSPIGVIKGFNMNVKPLKSYPDENGIITIEINELERIELYIDNNSAQVEENGSKNSKFKIQNSKFYSGCQLVGSRLKRLPIGSTLDTKKGVFYWLPGPGFVGRYALVFVDTESNQMRQVNVKILPKRWQKIEK